MTIFKNPFKSLAMKCQVHKQQSEEQFHHCSCPHGWKPVFKQSTAWPGRKASSPHFQHSMYRFLQGGHGEGWGYLLPGPVFESQDFWCFRWATLSQGLVSAIFSESFLIRPLKYKVVIPYLWEEVLGCAHHTGLIFRAALSLLPWLAELARARNHNQCITSGTALSSPNIPRTHSKLIIIS